MTCVVPKWKKDETDFTVAVNKDSNGTAMCRLPKPMVDKLGIDNKIRFRLLRSRVDVSKP